MQFLFTGYAAGKLKTVPENKFFLAVKFDKSKLITHNLI